MGRRGEMGRKEKRETEGGMEREREGIEKRENRKGEGGKRKRDSGAS